MLNKIYVEHSTVPVTLTIEPHASINQPMQYRYTNQEYISRKSVQLTIVALY